MGSATVSVAAFGVSPNASSRRTNWFGERDRPGRYHRRPAGDLGEVSGEDAGYGSRDARAPHGFTARQNICVYLRPSADGIFAEKL